MSFRRKKSISDIRAREQMRQEMPNVQYTKEGTVFGKSRWTDERIPFGLKRLPPPGTLGS